MAEVKGSYSSPKSQVQTILPIVILFLFTMAVLGIYFIEIDIYTVVFLGISAAAVIIAFYHFKGQPVDSPLYVRGPALLTTIGVLGTFVGIFWGLIGFNVEKIDESVPQLLQGLKFAFLTSILGISMAIRLRFLHARNRDGTVEVEDPAVAIHRTLESIKESIDNGSEQQRTALENLQKAISADSESSLLTQVQKLRMDFMDGQKDLIKEFRGFAKTMAESNSKALIEALEEVIRDFNTQLNEQFGDNFKQLNEAVGALLRWQERYREHIEQLERNFETALQGINESEESLREIVSYAASIPKTLDNMEQIQVRLSDATNDLNGHLEAISSLKNQALEAFPVIENNLETLTSRFRQSIQNVVEQSAQVLDRQQEAHQELQHGYIALLDNSNESQKRFANALNSSFQKTEKKITNTFDSFEKRTQDALHQNIQAMGQHLASLSEKFVRDYRPLVEELRRIIAIARDVNR